ncbi:MAG: response regulator [Thermodesulfobacteriota bacterium]
MPLSLLLVDDSPVSRMMLRRVLPPADFEIEEVSSGRECLDRYREKRADLVFLDLTMPGLSGFDTLAQLKKLDPQVKVVVLTADVQAKSLALALELGALEVIRKPPRAEDIRSAMERFLP